MSLRLVCELVWAVLGLIIVGNRDGSYFSGAERDCDGKEGGEQELVRIAQTPKFVYTL
jgi:hypothetical protein